MISLLKTTGFFFAALLFSFLFSWLVLGKTAASLLLEWRPIVGLALGLAFLRIFWIWLKEKRQGKTFLSNTVDVGIATAKVVPSRKNRLTQAFFGGMKEFGEAISQLVTTILLGITYFIAVGLTHALSRLMGKQFCVLKPSPATNSYWKPVEQKSTLESYLQQF